MARWGSKFRIRCASSCWTVSAQFTGRELEDAVLRPAGEQAEQVAEVAPRLDVHHRTARQERGEGRVHTSGVVAARGTSSFFHPTACRRSSRSEMLLSSGAAIVQDAAQPLSLVPGVAHAVVDRRVLEHLVELGVAPREEALDDRRAVLGADLPPPLPRRLRDRTLDPEQRADHAERLLSAPDPRCRTGSPNGYRSRPSSTWPGSIAERWRAGSRAPRSLATLRPRPDGS